MSAPASQLPPVPPIEEIAGSTCAAHPTRTAAALCRVCLARCCGECTTRIQGVNHCARCLARAFPPRPEPPPPFRAFAARARLPRSALRIAGVLAAYGSVALLAAAYGIAMPFFENERRLSANKDRLSEVHLALTGYYNDVGRWPSADRGLSGLLAASAEDRDDWGGPYTTARATAGKAPHTEQDQGKVLDVFGRPVFYFASPLDPPAENQEEGDEEIEEETEPAKVYIASRGANGTWDTPGVETGNAPREPLGDDVVDWLAWP